MSGVGGVIGGVVGLSLLELVLANSTANGHVNDVLGIVSKALDYWLDPTIPLIPDLTPPTTHVEAPGVLPHEVGSAFAQAPPSTLKHTIGPGATVNT